MSFGQVVVDEETWRRLEIKFKFDFLKNSLSVVDADLFF